MQPLLLLLVLICRWLRRFGLFAIACGFVFVVWFCGLVLVGFGALLCVLILLRLVGIIVMFLIIYFFYF